MSSSSKRVAQQQFGEHAQEYVSSMVHAQGYSLKRVVELINPQPDWQALDVATGGGHMALALSGRVARVVAADLTYAMLLAARQFTGNNAAGEILFVRTDSESMGFADASFDCVTCRIAPHHFPNVNEFIRECNRVLVPGGVLAVVDNIVSGEPAIADYVNALERLRDPSHHWAYPLADWEVFFESSGFVTAHSESFLKELEFDDWADRLGVQGNDRYRLQAMLMRAPENVEEYLQPRMVRGKLLFTLMEMIMMGRKPE